MSWKDGWDLVNWTLLWKGDGATLEKMLCMNKLVEFMMHANAKMFLPFLLSLLSVERESNRCDTKALTDIFKKNLMQQRCFTGSCAQVKMTIYSYQIRR